MGVQKAAIINMSSMLGSVELNTTGGLYPYRCSKVQVKSCYYIYRNSCIFQAALNIASKSLSLDLKDDGILVTCLHPGWVKTDLGGNNAPMEINDSVSSIVKLLYNLNEQHNGGFYDFDGKSMPWQIYLRSF